MPTQNRLPTAAVGHRPAKVRPDSPIGSTRRVATEVVFDGGMISDVKYEETVCERCCRVVRKTLAGACVVCGALVGAPASVVTHVAGPLAPVPMINAAPLVDQEGPHNLNEIPFARVPSAESGGTALAITASGGLRFAPMSMGGTT